MSVLIRATSLAIACALASSPAVAAQARRLFPVRDGQRVGYIDAAGRLVVGFDALSGLTVTSDFWEGLAAVCVQNPETGFCADSAHGYVDETGKFVIPPRFRYAGPFIDGLAIVYMKQGEGGAYINRRGEEVIKLPEGSVTYGFTDGLAIVFATGGEGKKFIDRSGRTVIRPNFHIVGNFSEGLAPVVVQRYGRDEKYGYIDKQGELVIPARFEPEREHHGFIRAPHGFSGGLALVKIGSSYGYINRKGVLVIPAQFALAVDFTEGFACVWRRADGDGEYIDVRGRRAFGRSFGRYLGQFHEGLAAVAVKTQGGEKWGYIDRHGRFVIKPQFDGVYPFSGGLASVYMSDGVFASADWWVKARYGYINRKGKYVWRQPKK